MRVVLERRFLGGSGLAVSAVGYGAMSFSDFYGPTDEEASHAILDAMRDLGMTHLDSANVYGAGRSERWIGSYLARDRGARGAFVIATKAGIGADAQGRRVVNNDPAYLEEQLDASLARLGTDHVDLFYVHRREEARPIEEVAEALAAIMAKGKARAVGFSEIAPASLRRARAVCRIDAVQSEYSLQTRAPDLGLVQACAELGVALVAFSPVGRSLLTDRPLGAEAVAQSAFLRGNPRFQGVNFARNIEATDRFRAFARERGEPAAALAIAWLLSRGAQVLPIPGTRSVSHLREAARGAEIVLSAEDKAAIDAILPVGWAWGDRYDSAQWVGVERYC